MSFGRGRKVVGTVVDLVPVVVKRPPHNDIRESEGCRRLGLTPGVHLFVSMT